MKLIAALSMPCLVFGLVACGGRTIDGPSNEPCLGTSCVGTSGHVDGQVTDTPPAGPEVAVTPPASSQVAVTPPTDAPPAATVPAPQCDSGSSHETSFTASALIDGQSLLHVGQHSVFWEHRTYAGPGLHDFQTLPTQVTTVIDGLSKQIAWCPRWANGCNNCDGTCGELRDPMNSEPLEIEAFPSTALRVSLSCDGRETCHLVQSPSPENGEFAIIDIDDESAGPATYTATLLFEYCR